MKRQHQQKTAREIYTPRWSSEPPENREQNQEKQTKQQKVQCHGRARRDAKDRHPGQQCSLIKRRISAEHLRSRNRKGLRQRRVVISTMQKIMDDRAIIEKGVIRR